MHRTTLLASALAALLAGSASFAFAQSTPAAAPTTSSTTAQRPNPMRKHAGDMHQRMAMRQGAGRMQNGVVGDLRGLERLYMQAGRSKELSAVYTDVLARSQNPRIRNYVSHRLARLQAQPTNVDQAIATLRKNLDENLVNDAKQRTDREKMRANWQQQRGQKSPTPANN